MSDDKTDKTDEKSVPNPFSSHSWLEKEFEICAECKGEEYKELMIRGCCQSCAMTIAAMNMA